MDHVPSASPEQSIFESIRRLPDIRGLAAEYLDTGLDLLVENPALEAIPVVGSIRALTRGAITFREARYTQKLLKFLTELGPSTDADVEYWQEKLQNEPTETGARILDVLDRVTALRKAEIIAWITRLWLDGECERETFFRAIEMVEKALTEDLEEFLRAPEQLGSYEGVYRLIATGLAIDQSEQIVTERSQPPALSREGQLLTRAVEER